jgi:hypothetical protein
MGDAIVVAMRDRDGSGKGDEGNAQETDQQPPARNPSHLVLLPPHTASIEASF